MQLLSKINILERQIQKAPVNYESVVKKWVQSEMTYDVLTDEQKSIYDSYWGLDLRAAYESLGVPMDFQLELRPKTKKEEQERFKMRVAEVREMFDRFRDEYNAPEAVAQRRAEYEELQRIGELRRRAFERGESMDRYPLPWEGQQA